MLRAAVPCLLLGAATAADLPAGDFWFGLGCLWRMQHVFTTKFEQAAPYNRAAEQLQATAGYAGGTRQPEYACYPNPKNESNYEDYGDAEVVKLDIRTTDELTDAARVYFADFASIGKVGPNGTDVWVRPDFLDRGAPYRAVIGVPGGVGNTAAMDVLNKADVNIHGLGLLEGKGNDADTLATQTVWVYDTTVFAYRVAELCMQYHDDAGEVYSDEYHALRGARKAAGTLRETPCPLPYPCLNKKQQQ